MIELTTSASPRAVRSEFHYGVDLGGVFQYGVEQAFRSKSCLVLSDPSRKDLVSKYAGQEFVMLHGLCGLFIHKSSWWWSFSDMLALVSGSAVSVSMGEIKKYLYWTRFIVSSAWSLESLYPIDCHDEWLVGSSFIEREQRRKNLHLLASAFKLIVYHYFDKDGNRCAVSCAGKDYVCSDDLRELAVNDVRYHKSIEGDYIGGYYYRGRHEN